MEVHFLDGPQVPGCPFFGHVEGGSGGSSEHEDCVVGGGIVSSESLEGPVQGRAVEEFGDHGERRVAEDEFKGEQMIDVLGSEGAAEHVGFPAQAVVGDSDPFDIFLEQIVSTAIGFDEHDGAGTAAECFEADRTGSGKQVSDFATADEIEVFESLEENFLEQAGDGAGGVARWRQQFSASVLSGNDLQI